MGEHSEAVRGVRREGPVRAVTQVMLAKYLEVEELWRVRQELRMRLIGLLEAGATIEPRKLTARIDYGDRVALSRTNLTRTLGEAEFERLAAAVGSTLCRYLRVTADTRGPRPALAQSEQDRPRRAK